MARVARGAPSSCGFLIRGWGIREGHARTEPTWGEGATSQGVWAPPPNPDPHHHVSADRISRRPLGPPTRSGPRQGSDGRSRWFGARLRGTPRASQLKTAMKQERAGSPSPTADPARAPRGSVPDGPMRLRPRDPSRTGGPWALAAAEALARAARMGGGARGSHGRHWRVAAEGSASIWTPASGSALP